MRVRIALLAALLALAPGCFVFEELDAGMALMDGPKKAKAPETKPDAAAAADDKPTGAEWWQKARTLNGEPSADLVQCQIDGGTQFMREIDCRTRGGVVL